MEMIREYDPKDALQVEECIVELHDFLRAIDSKVAEGKTIGKKYLEYLLVECAATNGKIFVCEKHDEIAGMVCVLASVRSDSPDEEDYEYAFISDVVVLAGHRGKGLGKALLQHAEDYARLNGAQLLRINVLARNDVARNLYAGYGFQENEITFQKRLTGQDAI